MSDLPTPIEKFKLTVTMDATITVFDPTGEPVSWLKPGTSASMTWRGVPTETELVLGYQTLSQAASVTLEDVVTSSRTRLDEARRGR